jgi:hypothetical protein
MKERSGAVCSIFLSHSNFMGQSPYLEANSRSVSQEFHMRVWKLKVHCRINNSPLTPILSPISRINYVRTHFFKNFLNIIFPSILRSTKVALYLQTVQLKSVGTLTSLARDRRYVVPLISSTVI